MNPWIAALLFCGFLALSVGIWLAFGAEPEKRDENERKGDRLNGMVAAGVLAVVMFGILGGASSDARNVVVPIAAAASHQLK